MKTAWLLLALVACASLKTRAAPHHQPSAPPESARAERAGSSCPMMVEGAKVSLRDAQGGVAMVFTTDGKNVEELRGRVDRMAQLEQNGMMPMADAQVRVEDVENGAQIVFIPAEPRQVEMMRVYLQKAAASLESGECPTSEVAEN